jgi:hypothetical protein
MQIIESLAVASSLLSFNVFTVPTVCVNRNDIKGKQFYLRLQPACGQASGVNITVGSTDQSLETH